MEPTGHIDKLRRFGFPLLVCTVAVALTATISQAQPLEEKVGGDSVVQVFVNDDIRFSPDSADGNAREKITVLDNGRLIQTDIGLPVFTGPVRITAKVVLRPIAKDYLSVHDKWDRAGSIRLVAGGRPDLEIVKFVTAYGGRTDWTVDVSHLAPVLRGPVSIAAFIDTWVNPAWKVDFSLEYTVDSTLPEFHWVSPVFFENSFDLETYADTGIEIQTDVPPGQQRVMLYYFTSGHCTDGRGADEFVKKDHVLSVDDFVVFRFRPWRDDCRQFREINPYTKRWSNGWWSSDYPRSGWCPGDVVAPNVLDLSDHLTPGSHKLGFRIESIRPKDEEGHYGYWRTSAFLVGQSDPK
ncbi:MAG: hypothetical protein GY867_09440 [bacterium]|nr:hypothetical protein [bacterium]